MTEEERKRKEQLSLTESGKPLDYSSQYAEDIARLQKQQQERQFDYDPAADRLFQTYADRYQQQGKLAMKDTVGRSSALTGGYGNTYAQAAGQQAYDAYLQKLGDLSLQTYDRAYKRYTDEGDALQQQAENLADAEQEDYRRYLDALSGWREDRGYDYKAARDEEKLAGDRQEKAYGNLYQLIAESGYIPEDGELETAGMTREAAEALRQAYLAALAAKQRSGGSGGGSGSRGTGGGEEEPQPQNMYSAVLAEVNALKTAGSSSSTIASRIQAAFAAGTITAAQRDSLLRSFT